MRRLKKTSREMGVNREGEIEEAEEGRQKRVDYAPGTLVFLNLCFLKSIMVANTPNQTSCGSVRGRRPAAKNFPRFNPHQH